MSLTWNDTEFVSLNDRDIFIGGDLSATGGAYTDYVGLDVNTGGVTIFTGSATDLEYLTTDAGGMTRIGGPQVTSYKNQSFNDTVFLTSDTTFETKDGGSITFAKKVDSVFREAPRTIGTRVTATGNVNFNGTVGAGHGMNRVTASSDKGNIIFSGTVDAGGEIFADSDTGNITFDGALDSGGIISAMTTGSGGAGGDIYFNGTVDSDSAIFVSTIGRDSDILFKEGGTANAGYLKVSAAGSSGDVTFEKAVVSGGAITASASTGGLLTFTGDVTSNGSLQASVTGNGSGESNLFSGNVKTNGGVLQATTSGSSSGIRFEGNVDTLNAGATAAGGITLATSGASSHVTLGGNLGSSGRRVGAVSVNRGSSGNKTFNGNIYGAGLTVNSNGVTALNGTAYNTTGDQTYYNDVTISGDTVITCANVDFRENLNGSVAGSDLDITGNAAFRDDVGNTLALGGLTVSGTTAIYGTDGSNTIRTSGAQTYTGAVALNADTTLTTTLKGSTLSFGNTVNGSRKLNLSGNGVFNNSVGSTQALSSLTVSGTSVFNEGASSVTTSGTQAYNGAVTLNASGLTLNSTTAGTGLVDFNSTVAMNDKDLTVTADNIDIGGNFSGTGNLVLQANDSNRNIFLNHVGAGLSFETDEINRISSGGTLASVTIGRSGGTGSITAGSATFTDPLTLLAARVDVNGTLTGTGDASVTARAATVNLGGDIMTSGGDITLDGNVYIGNGKSVTLSTGNTLTGNIRVTGTTDGIYGAGDENIQLVSGDGSIAPDGAVGAGVSLGNITLQDDNAGNTGTVTLNGPVNAGGVTTYAHNYGVVLNDKATFSNNELCTV